MNGAKPNEGQARVKNSADMSERKTDFSDLNIGKIINLRDVSINY